MSGSALAVRTTPRARITRVDSAGSHDEPAREVDSRAEARGERAFGQTPTEPE